MYMSEQVWLFEPRFEQYNNYKLVLLVSLHFFFFPTKPIYIFLLKRFVVVVINSILAVKHTSGKKKKKKEKKQNKLWLSLSASRLDYDA